MKRLCATVAILALSGGLALAQSGGGGSSGGSAGGSTGGTGAGSSSTPGSTVNGPNNTGGPVPGLSTTQPSDDLTVGRAPGVNPANPQDMKAFDNGVPQIIVPERR
ncbi:MAG: hypothetical protein EXQ83_03060 [Xanthobacteraceae bacterium]|nr:hypothetical protein [Xanthobacteraceae bacterium]